MAPTRRQTPPTTKTKRLNLRLDQETYQRLCDAAAKDERKPSPMAEKLLRQALRVFLPLGE